MEKIKQAFDDWYASENGYAPEKTDDGKYKTLSVMRQYEAWCAALKFARNRLTGE